MNIALDNNTNKNIVNHKNFLFYFFLAVILFSYGHNDILDLLLCILTLNLFLLNLKKNRFIYSYFALIFFEPILILPIIDGSFFRIYQIIFFIRILLELIKNVKYKNSNVLNVFAAIIFFLLSTLYTLSLIDLVSTFVNVIILIYILIHLLKTDKKRHLNEIFAVVSVFSILSGLYGFIFSTGLNFGYATRYGATIGDPNYSSLFYTLGFFALLGTDKFKKKTKILLSIVFISLLLSTVSLTGILGTLFLFIIYLCIISPSKSILYIFLILVLTFLFFEINFSIGSSLYGIQYRMRGIIGLDDLAQITSSRTTIFTNYYDYFRSLPWSKQLFGGTNIISGDMRESMISMFGAVSHNSYIDILYLTGIIGLLLILTMFSLMIFNSIKMFFRTKENVYLSLAFLKITLLYYSLAISFFTFRYFYTFFIL
jgi:O-antigen ligase